MGLTLEEVASDLHELQGEFEKVLELLKIIRGVSKKRTGVLDEPFIEEVRFYQSEDRKA